MSFIYARRNPDHPNGITHYDHPCCFGGLSYLFQAIRPAKNYDARIYVTTRWQKDAAQEYMKGFRKHMKQFIFKRGDQKVVFKAPKVRYFRPGQIGGFQALDKLLGARRTINEGYFEITIPQGVLEYEAYAMIKLFAKTPSYPFGSTGSGWANGGQMFLEIMEQAQDWNIARTVYGLMGGTGAYWYPVQRQSWTDNGYMRDVLKNYLFSGIHEFDVPHQMTNVFGSGATNPNERNQVGISIQCQPLLASKVAGGFLFSKHLGRNPYLRENIQHYVNEVRALKEK
ncbi:hypothetical protein DNAM_570 [Pseudomonas phage BroderSalsa]|nr:hypothetical protein DNAM_570 [Pseudomonas phage BroderSalsa]